MKKIFKVSWTEKAELLYKYREKIEVEVEDADTESTVKNKILDIIKGNLYDSYYFDFVDCNRALNIEYLEDVTETELTNELTLKEAEEMLNTIQEQESRLNEIIFKLKNQ
jgi:hypothetical protein